MKDIPPGKKNTTLMQSAPGKLPNVSSAHVAHRPAHLEWLDSLRALAALYVVISHIVRTCFPDPSGMNGLTLVAAGAFRYGHFAVGLFIVLSGYSLMLPVTRNGGVLKISAWQFYLKRAKRILPPYYLALGLSLLFIRVLISQNTGTDWDDAIPVRLSDIVAHLFLVHDLYAPYKINYPMWSIAVEWRIYFFFPVLVALFHRFGALRIALAMIVLSGIGFATLQGTRWFGIMPAYYALFVLGMLACRITYSADEALLRIKKNVAWGICAVVSGIGFVAMLYLWRNAYSEYHYFLTDMMNGVFVFCVMVFLGTFAYSIYLIHAPLLQIIWQYGLMTRPIPDLLRYMILTFLGLPTILLASYLFFLGCEKPFLNTKKPATTPTTEPAI